MSGQTSRCLKMLNFVFRKVLFFVKNIQKHKNHNKQNHNSYRQKKITKFICQEDNKNTQNTAKEEMERNFQRSNHPRA